MWVGFLLSGVAAVLGLYQLLERDELVATSAAGYYQSATLHGVVQAFVLTTFFIVGFGYFVTTTSLERRVRWPRLAWLGFWTMLVGSVVAALAIVSGRATVLYTFYPPMIAHWSFYAGAALLLVGSLAWTAITIAMTVAWKRENPGRPVPLPQFGMTSCAMLWAWTLVGVVLEVVFQLLPLSLGMTQTIDVGLARALFAWTLHPIVYFWLIPAYVTLYAIVPKAAGGYLFSDEAGRIVFVMLLVFSLPIGLHHVFVDPEQAAGWKLMHTLGTFLVALPTLLTGFTVAASLETAGRLRGGKGLFGWIGRLPWGEPVALGGILAVFTLLPGGFGGLVNASYAMDAMVHNTAWITAHFHLILGGTVVTVYFASAYALWPKLTGRRLYSKGMADHRSPAVVRRHLHPHDSVALPGPALDAAARRLHALRSPDRRAVEALERRHGRRRRAHGALDGALPRQSPPDAPQPGGGNRSRDGLCGDGRAGGPVPALLNGFAVWNFLLVALMAIAWAYPIGQFFFIGVHKALAWGFR